MSHYPHANTCALGFAPSKPSALARILAGLALWRSRKQLAELEPHQLNDLGISRKQANQEANRAIWDVPAQWIK